MTHFPDFVASFKRKVKKLDDLGKRNQGVDGGAVDSVTEEVLGMNCILEITNYPVVKKPKTMRTNSNGIFATMNLKVGTWRCKVSCPGYITQYVTIKVDARRMVLSAVKLVAFVLPVEAA